MVMVVGGNCIGGMGHWSKLGAEGVGGRALWCMLLHAAPKFLVKMEVMMMMMMVVVIAMMV